MKKIEGLGVDAILVDGTGNVTCLPFMTKEYSRIIIISALLWSEPPCYVAASSAE